MEQKTLSFRWPKKRLTEDWRSSNCRKHSNLNLKSRWERLSLMSPHLPAVNSRSHRTKARACTTWHQHLRSQNSHPRQWLVYLSSMVRLGKALKQIIDRLRINFFRRVHLKWTRPCLDWSREVRSINRAMAPSALRRKESQRIRINIPPLLAVRKAR